MTRHAVGRVDEFPVGRWRVLRVEGREIGVFNTGERLHAVRNRCPHEGGPLCMHPLRGTWLPGAPGELEYGLEGRVVRCSWHGWEFDVESGEMVFGTGPLRLTAYEVAVEDDQVVLDLGRRRGAPAAPDQEVREE